MSTAEKLFSDIVAGLPGAKESKMFGALCAKMPNGKAAVLLKHDYMVFKLAPQDEAAAMELSGAEVFNPKGDRPMKGWTAVPLEHAAKWPLLAKQAAQYVAQLEPNKKKSK